MRLQRNFSCAKELTVIYRAYFLYQSQRVQCWRWANTKLWRKTPLQDSEDAQGVLLDVQGPEHGIQMG